MGERLSGNGVPGPGDAVSGPGGVRHDVALETVLAAVLRARALDPETEQRAAAAFRDAREYGRQQVGAQRRQIGEIEGIPDVTTVPPAREQARAAQDSEVAGNLRG